MSRVLRFGLLALSAVTLLGLFVTPSLARDYRDYDRPHHRYDRHYDHHRHHDTIVRGDGWSVSVLRPSYHRPLAYYPVAPVLPVTQVSNTYWSPWTGGPCRNYNSTIYRHGHPQIVQGTACLAPDGVWRSVR